jgi:DNA-binding transcriptional regulator YiaG
MLIGRIAKEQGSLWSAEVDAIGAFTKGTSRKDAISMLGESDGVIAVLVDATQPSRLAAQVLKYQREVHGLSLADVARLLGTSSRNAYASYEQGRTEPTLGKFRELLMAVAPDMALVVGPRIGPRAAPPIKKRKSARGR